MSHTLDVRGADADVVADSARARGTGTGPGRSTSGASRGREPDAACAAAVDLARAAACQAAGSSFPAIAVGDHLGTRAAGDRVVLHFFACCHRGYPGWRWAVTVVRAARAKTATVSECALLPGEEALLAPDWVPWRDRLRPGDLGVGDLLPVGADDERLAALVLIAGDDAVVDWYADTAADTAESVVDGRLAQFLPGRVRVLSATGRDDAAQRWHAGDHGPYAPLARAAPAGCASCGFFVSLSGALGQLFGVCANAYAPDDGRVVAADHGCGAHSEAVRADQNGGLATPVIDEFGYDLVDLPGVSVEETVFEPFSPGT